MTLILAIFLFITGCSEEGTIQQQDNSIYGTWQLIERFDGGSPVPTQPISNGEIITFSNESIYSNDSYECNGVYNINDSIIEISVLCVTTESLNYSFIIENNELMLTDYPSACDEGCYDKYKRM